jgi:hypothetical protein
VLSDELFQPDVERRLNAQGVTSSFITTSFTTSFTTSLLLDALFQPDVERRLNALTYADVC